MAYSTDPNLPKASAIALKLLIQDGLAVSVVARKCGVHRSTIWRWKKKWLAQNDNLQLENYNRPSRKAGTQFRQASIRWNIVTNSSRPHQHPNAIQEQLVRLVLDVRRELRRCAEVVWHHLIRKLGSKISLSSVKRILRSKKVCLKSCKLVIFLLASSAQSEVNLNEPFWPVLS